MLKAIGLEKSRHIRESVGDQVFLFFVYLFLGAVLLIVLYPLIYIVSSSLSSPLAVSSGGCGYSRWNFRYAAMR